MSDPEREDGEPEKPRFAFEKKVDLDWKRKVQKEKERLAAGLSGEEPAPPPPPSEAGKKEKKEEGKPQEAPPPKGGMDMGFLAVVQQLADQAAVFLGLVPGYERNCEQALAAVEMLRALQEKTKGNLSAQESKALTGVLYELQMRYVQACGSGA